MPTVVHCAGWKWVNASVGTPLRLREAREALDRNQQSLLEERQPLAEDHQVGVVGHVARRGAEVDPAARRGALLAEGVDVGHHVVPDLALARVGHVEVHVG